MPKRSAGIATRIAVAVLAAAISVSVSGCFLIRRPVTTPQPPDSPAGIVGEVMQVSRATEGATWGALLVEGGTQPQGAVSDKASVTIDAKTLIAREGRWIPPDELEVGMTVAVWFTGPVAESYPVQGTASFIEVR